MDATITKRASIDCIIQKMVLHPMRQHIMYALHYPSSAYGSGQQYIFDYMHREYYWTYMAQALYHAVSDCSNCVRNRVALKQNLHFQVFFIESKSFEFVAMDILQPLPGSTKRDRKVIIITEKCFKRTETIPTACIVTTNVVYIFWHDWSIPHRIQL